MAWKCKYENGVQYFISYVLILYRNEVTNSGKIIIIFEGIDCFLNGFEYVPVDFWLPKIFPPKVKVICTLSKKDS